nr:MAG TPA: hypothetical protein [Caudoviricetes sp.]
MDRWDQSCLSSKLPFLCEAASGSAFVLGGIKMR